MAEAHSNELTLVEFASKVEWEGGVFDALQYGLKSTDIDIDSDPNARRLADIWEALEHQHQAMAQLIDEACEIMDGALDAYEDSL